MSSFEFIFSLFGLLLGLSMAELLGGLARAIKNRRRAPVGRLTPLLATFLLLDLTSSWMSAWNNRGWLDVNYATLVLGLLYAGTYYVAATLTFPREGEEWESLDHHYMTHARPVVGATAMLNLMLVLLLTGGRPWALPAAVMVLQIGYFGASGVILWTRRYWLNIAALAGLIGIYLVATGMEWARMG